MRRLFIWLVLAGAGNAAPAYYRDIAPILYSQCAACHRPGEAAPFSLLTYSDARKHAAQIAQVTQSRYMPPWLPEPGSVHFLGERRLTGEQIAAIRAWADAGAPEGNPAEAPPAPAFTPGWQLGQPDLVLTAPKPYTLAPDGPDVFRNFVLRVPLDGERYVRAVEIRPGNKKVVHHANLLIDRSLSSRRREAADGQPGFPGMDLEFESVVFEPDSHFLFWKPGSPAVEEPEDMAWRLDGRTDLVLNMHLRPSGKPELIQPSVGLYFSTRAPSKKPMLLQLEHDGAIDIAPGEKTFTITDALKLPVDVEVLGVYPHAHYLGRQMEAYATLPDGSRVWLIRIPDWDLNWQSVFFYRKPVFLKKGSVISMRYTYDNSAGNPRNPSHPPRRVRSGNQSTDEMGHLWLQVLPRSSGAEDGRLLLQEASARARLKKYPDDFSAHYNLAAVLQSRSQWGEAERLFRAALRIRPESAAGHNNLGAVLLAWGKRQEALQEFRAALRSDPGYTNASYNLGQLALEDNAFGEAAEQWRRVAAADPEDPVARRHLSEALQGESRNAIAAKRWDEAAELLQQALSDGGDDADVRTNLGAIYAIQGKLQAAVEQFEAALRLNPAGETARANLARARAEIAAQHK